MISFCVWVVVFSLLALFILLLTTLSSVALSGIVLPALSLDFVVTYPHTPTHPQRTHIHILTPSVFFRQCLRLLSVSLSLSPPLSVCRSVSLLLCVLKPLPSSIDLFDSLLPKLALGCSPLWPAQGKRAVSSSVRSLVQWVFGFTEAWGGGEGGREGRVGTGPRREFIERVLDVPAPLYFKLFHLFVFGIS